MSIRRRIATGIGANAFGQMLTIGMQLVALPMYLHFWDAARYGTWLMLSAVPSYFSMADVGMVTAAGNKMTMEVGRGDETGANRTFQSAFVFMLVTCCTMLALSVLILMLVNFSKISNAEYKLTLGLLIGGVLIAFFNGMTEAIFRATGRYGLGTTLGQLTRLGEWSGGMLGLCLTGSFVAVAFGMLLARTVGLFVVVTYSARTTSTIKWGVRRASAVEVRSMVRPAAMFMMFPVVNALTFQGFTLLVGGLFGTISVAVFNTYRTMARVTVQATSTLSFAAGPEMSRLFGASNKGSLKRLFHRANTISAVLALVLPLAIALVGPTLLAVWTRGRIPYHASLLWVMLLYAAVSSLWHVPRVLLLSINRHSRMAVYSLLAATSSLIVAFIVGKLFSLVALVWVLVISEMVMAICVQRLAVRILENDESSDDEVRRTAVP